MQDKRLWCCGAHAHRHWTLCHCHGLVLQDALLEGFKNKVPKVVLTCVATLNEAVRYTIYATPSAHTAKRALP